MSYLSLSSSDLKRIGDFQDSLSGLHTRDEVIDFSLRFLKEAIACDFVGWNQIHAEKREFLDARIFPSLGSVSTRIIEPIARTLHTYKIFQHYYSIPYNVFDTTQIADLVAHSRFLDSPIFKEAYIHFDAKQQLHTQIPSEQSHARILYNVTRKSLKFSDRDKQFLDLVGRQTFRRLKAIPGLLNETLVSRFYDAYDHQHEGLVKLHSDFSVMDISVSAKQLLKVFFPEYSGSYTLPLRVRQWVYNSIRINGVQDLGINIRKTTTFHRWGRILIAILLKTPYEKYGILSLQEDPVAHEQYLKLTKGLTRRQRQLYQLMKEGVSDPSEIADRLGISVRTVADHRIRLRQIVGKIRDGTFDGRRSQEW